MTIWNIGRIQLRIVERQQLVPICSSTSKGKDDEEKKKLVHAENRMARKVLVLVKNATNDFISEWRRIFWEFDVMAIDDTIEYDPPDDTSLSSTSFGIKQGFVPNPERFSHNIKKTVLSLDANDYKRPSTQHTLVKSQEAVVLRYECSYPDSKLDAIEKQQQQKQERYPFQAQHLLEQREKMQFYIDSYKEMLKDLPEVTLSRTRTTPSLIKEDDDKEKDHKEEEYEITKENKEEPVVPLPCEIPDEFNPAFDITKFKDKAQCIIFPNEFNPDTLHPATQHHLVVRDSPLVCASARPESIYTNLTFGESLKFTAFAIRTNAKEGKNLRFLPGPVPRHRLVPKITIVDKSISREDALDVARVCEPKVFTVADSASSSSSYLHVSFPHRCTECRACEGAVSVELPDIETLEGKEVDWVVSIETHGFYTVERIIDFMVTRYKERMKEKQKDQVEPTRMKRQNLTKPTKPTKPKVTSKDMEKDKVKEKVKGKVKEKEKEKKSRKKK